MDMFRSEIGSGFEDPGGTTPTKNSEEYPPRGANEAENRAQ